MSKLYFRRVDFKYQVTEAYRHDWINEAPRFPGGQFMVSLSGPHGGTYCEFYKGGTTVYTGAFWDGPSGPAVDTPAFMQASLVHDMLYRAVRENKFDSLGNTHVQWKDFADKELKSMCLANGMWSVRAWYVYHAVRIFGNGAIKTAKARHNREYVA